MQELHDLQLITACEGPLALNDYVFDLCRDLLPPDGARFCQQIRRYGDYLAKAAQEPDYQAENPLKLILPFLKAHGLTNAQISEHAHQQLMLVPDATGAYNFLHAQRFPIFALSTGYRQFAVAAAKKLGFSPKNIFAAELDLDHYKISEAEKAELLGCQQEIAQAPDIVPPPEAVSPEDLPPPVREAVQVCDRIFKEKVPQMEIGALYQEVQLLGGPEKARAVSEILTRSDLTLKDTIYVGDGLSDVQVLEAVKTGGGLGISFNGDINAIKAAEVCLIADNAWPIALIASVFVLWGKEGIMEIATKGQAGASRYLVLPEAVIDYLMQGLKGRNFNLYASNARDPETTAQESMAMQAKLRGAALAGGTD